MKPIHPAGHLVNSQGSITGQLIFDTFGKEFKPVMGAKAFAVDNEKFAQLVNNNKVQFFINDKSMGPVVAYTKEEIAVLRKNRKPALCGVDYWKNDFTFYDTWVMNPFATSVCIAATKAVVDQAYVIGAIYRDRPFDMRDLQIFDDKQFQIISKRIAENIFYIEAPFEGLYAYLKAFGNPVSVNTMLNDNPNNIYYKKRIIGLRNANADTIKMVSGYLNSFNELAGVR